MTYSDQLDIRVTDTSLRDGSHAKRHQFTEEHVRSIVGALDDAGMPVIEVTHGDGLGGSSYNYGFSKTDERVLMKAAVETARRARIAALDAPRPRHEGRHQGLRRPGRVDRAGGDPLHRGRHLDPALRPGPGDRAGDGGVPDDGPLPAPGGAGEAGADHGRRRLPVRVRRGLGRRDGAGGRVGPRRRARGRAGRRRPGRVPRPREPRAVGGQQRAGRPGRRGADRRLHSRRSGPAPATRRWSASPPWPSGWASPPASTC